MQKSSELSDDARQTNSQVFSIMKALAILCVVAGHTEYAPVHDFVYLFHLAVFYFVSGYFFDDRYLASKKLFLWRRIRGLWFPFFGYCLAFLLLHNVFYRLHLYPEPDHLYEAADYVRVFSRFFIGEMGNWLLTPLWFIRSLFVASIVFFSILIVSKKMFERRPGYFSEVAAGVFALLIAMAVQSRWVSELSFPVPLAKLILQRDFAVVPLLFIGRWFRMFQSCLPTHAFCWGGAFVFLLLCQGMGVRMELSIGDFGVPMPVFFVISAIGCYFVYLTAFHLRKASLRLTGILVAAGRETFAIMALHLLAFKAVSLVQVFVYGYGWQALGAWPVIDAHTQVWWLPYTIFGMAVPMAWVWVKKRLTPRGLCQVPGGK